MSDQTKENSTQIKVEDVPAERINVAEAVTEVAASENESVDIAVSQAATEFISIDEKLGWAGGDSTNHNSLNGRYDPDQHTIASITGLSEKLKNIESLKSVQSDKIGHANYYKWTNDERRDEYGYFVSLVDYSDTIAICDGGDIFGVTLSMAGFIGGQNEDVPRGNDYAIVATSGLVDVRCESDVVVGDYIISNSYGIATKTNSTCGYKVIAKENKNGVDYAAIALGVQACTTDALDYKIQSLNGRMNNAEINIAAAMNAANEAYHKASDSITSNETMKGQVEEALDKVDGVITDVDDLGGQISEIATSVEQAKAIAELASTAAESAKNEAVEKANEALSKAVQIEETVDPISTWEYTDPVTGETHTGATYFAEYVQNGLSTKAEMETVSHLDEENKLLIEKNAEKYTQMLSSIDKYSVGEYSQAYGLTVEQARDILKDGMIYIPTKHDETSSHTETYIDGDSVVERQFTPGFYYTWTDDIMWSEAIGQVWFGEESPAGTTYTYWYDGDKLYIFNGSDWTEVVTLAGNVNNRITSMIRQDVNSVIAEVVTARGSAASLGAKITETESQVQTLASWSTDPNGNQYNLAAIKQTADDSGASISQIVKSIGADGSVSAASIIMAVNNDTSIATISANKINLSGVTTFLRPSDIGANGTTIIDGGRIQTGKIAAARIDASQLSAISANLGTVTAGVIQSQNYISGTSGVKLDLTNGTADITGQITATSGSLSNLTIKGKLYLNDTYYIDAKPNNDPYHVYIYLPGLMISDVTGAVFSGSLNAATGTFSGSLSAATGTFSGSLSAATGTFSGSLSAATGTFSGELLAATGTFSGSITATTGYFSNCTIDSSCNIAGRLSAAGNVNIGSVYDNDTGITCYGMYYSGVSAFLMHSSGFEIISNYSSPNAFSPRIVGGVNGIAICYNTNLGATTRTGCSVLLLPGGGSLVGSWYLNSSEMTASDRNKKNSISTITNDYELFFDGLKPVTYRYNDGTSNRLHSGFIAQDVETSLNNANIETQNFAGFVKKINDDGSEEYYLRYDEFIALNTWQIQKLKARIADLEATVKTLQENL